MKPEVDNGIQLAGCEYVNAQLSRLMQHLQGAQTAADIEDLHQARVACRRLRSALTVFSDCFDAGKLHTWNKHLKRLLRSFGAARDLDVQLEFLQSVLDGIDAEHKRDRPGIRRMLLRWQRRRDKAQPDVVKAVRKIVNGHVLMNIHLDVERILFELRHSGITPDSTALISRAVAQIQQRTDDLLARRACLDRPEAIDEHHAMRIAAKKLRYTLEIFDAALKGKLRGSIKKIKKIQTLLGDLHDCDVWVDDVTAFIDREKQRTFDFYGSVRPFARILPGLESLRMQRQACRGRLLNEARAYFEKLQADQFWPSFPDGLTVLPETTKEQESADHDLHRETIRPEPEQPENCDSL